MMYSEDSILNGLFFFISFKASQAWRKNKMDESKHEIHSQVDAITAGTASMVNLTAGRNSGTSLSSCNQAFFKNTLYGNCMYAPGARFFC